MRKILGVEDLNGGCGVLDLFLPSKARLGVWGVGGAQWMPAPLTTLLLLLLTR